MKTPVCIGVTRCQAPRPPVGLVELITFPDSSAPRQSREGASTHDIEEVACPSGPPYGSLSSTHSGYVQASAPPVGSVEVVTNPPESPVTHSGEVVHDTALIGAMPSTLVGADQVNGGRSADAAGAGTLKMPVRKASDTTSRSSDRRLERRRAELAFGKLRPVMLRNPRPGQLPPARRESQGLAGHPGEDENLGGVTWTRTEAVDRDGVNSAGTRSGVGAAGARVSAIERKLELDKLHAAGSLSDADYQAELDSIKEEMKKY